MTHVAHVCTSCGSLTIFVADSPSPRRCARCETIVHRDQRQDREAASLARKLGSRTRMRPVRELEDGVHTGS
jgi:hypothetical protein